MTKFVILTTQRSGSTVLARTLDKHPKVFCAGEIFLESKKNLHHPEWHFRNWKLLSGKQSKINKLINYPNLRMNAVPHLKKFYADVKKGTEARGFKLMYSHIKSAPFIWNYIVENDVKPIVLIRENVFKMALSRYRMSKTGIAHSSEQLEAMKIKIPAQKIFEQAMHLQQVNEKLLQAAANTKGLVIHYEDFENWNELFNKICTFINVPFAETAPVLEKVSTNNWRDLVENYAEIENAFENTNLAHFLN